MMGFLLFALLCVQTDSCHVCQKHRLAMHSRVDIA